MIVVQVGSVLYRHPHGTDAMPVDGTNGETLVVLDDDDHMIALHHDWNNAWNGDEEIIWDHAETLPPI